MATKSKIVSWLGVLLGIVTELYKVVVRRGGSDENFHFLATAQGEGVREQIAGLIRWASAEFGGNSFAVVADRSKTLAEFLAHYAIAESDEELRLIQWEPWPDRKDNVRVVLFPRNEFLGESDSQIVRELRWRGYRPADIAEIIGLAEQNELLFTEDFRNKRFILAMGTPVPSDSPDETGYLGLCIGAANLFLRAFRWSESPHPAATWIAAVPDRK